MLQFLATIKGNTAYLNLRECSFNIDRSAILNIDASLPNLRNLDLTGAYISDYAVEIIVEVLFHKLEWLKLGCNLISDEGAMSIAAALSTSTLTTLELDYNSIGDDGVIAIAAALSTCNLKILELSYNIHGSNGAIAIAEALPTSKLTQIRMRGNTVESFGAIAIADVLPKCPLLTDLDLYGCVMRDVGVMAIAAALPNCNLKMLDMGGNDIGMDGAQAIYDVLPYTQLTRLRVIDNHVNQFDLRERVIQLPTLRMFYVMHGKLPTELIRMIFTEYIHK